MKLVFLDFDGVLHPAGGAPGACLPFEWLPMLAELLESVPEVSLAIHSTWREVHPQDYLQEFLGSLGARVVGPVPFGPKEEAIRAFLTANHEVEDYLILDDSPCEFSADLRARLIACHPNRGVSDPEVQMKIQAWLQS